METIDTMKSSVEFVLGTGWMSRYEASRLAPGAVVRSARIAGTGYELRFNGERIADAAAAVIGQGNSARLCAQIEALELKRPPEPEPARGTDMAELLPFRIRLGAAKASVTELSGLGRTSVIDLGIEAGKVQEAELLIAGFPAAKGIVSVVGENMALRLTECPGRLASGEPFRTTGAVDFASTGKCKDYDFRRPDCFTKVQLEALASLHGDFLRSLGALAAGVPGIPAGMEIALVDQLNFSEFVESLPAGGLIVAAPCPIPPRPRIAEPDRPAKSFLDLSGAPAFPPAAALDLVRWQQERPSGGAVLAAGEALSGARDAVFSALRDAWKGSGALSPYPDAEFRRAKDKPALALSAYAGEYEMVALVSFRSGASGRLDIAYPLRTIEAALRTLTA